MKQHVIKLTYFKRTGKYYSTEFMTVQSDEYYSMIKAVKTVFRSGTWPGLVGPSDFLVHCVCTTEEFSVPFLLFPEELR